MAWEALTKGEGCVGLRQESIGFLDIPKVETRVVVISCLTDLIQKIFAPLLLQNQIPSLSIPQDPDLFLL